MAEEIVHEERGGTVERKALRVFWVKKIIGYRSNLNEILTAGAEVNISYFLRGQNVGF